MLPCFYVRQTNRVADYVSYNHQTKVLLFSVITKKKALLPQSPNNSTFLFIVLRILLFSVIK